MFWYKQPSYYFDLFNDFPENTEKVNETKLELIDFIHLFCTSFDELQSIIELYKSALKKHGILWISWPKGKSSIKTDLKRDLIREHLLQIGLVDVKIAAIDANWSGLKFVYRSKDR